MFNKVNYKSTRNLETKKIVYISWCDAFNGERSFCANSVPVQIEPINVSYS